MCSLRSNYQAHRRQVRLDQYAWCNRRAPTDSEARLWQALRGAALGVAFKRQVPLAGRYIVDFLAPQVRVVVEVDGSSHATQQLADERRDRQLARLGYRVLRIPAALVMRDLAAAVQRIAAALTP